VVRKLRDLRAEMDLRLAIPDDRLTVAAFLNRWVTRNLPGQVSDRTLDSYTDTVRLHLTPALGRKALRKLTVSDVDEFMAWKREKGYSENSVRIFRAVLRRALRQAEREDLVTRNVAALSASPRVRSDKRSRTAAGLVKVQPRMQSMGRSAVRLWSGEHTERWHNHSGSLWGAGRWHRRLRVGEARCDCPDWRVNATGAVRVSTQPRQRPPTAGTRASLQALSRANPAYRRPRPRRGSWEGSPDPVAPR
jgi:hypothetical protein